MAELTERVATLEELFAMYMRRADERDAELASWQQEHKKEFDTEMRKINKQWSDLARKMGTIVEDIVAPNVPRIAREDFGLSGEPDDFSVRRRVRHKHDRSKEREFDVIAVYGDVVVVVEVKSTPRVDDVNEFLAGLPDFTDYLPEHRGKRIIPVLASLSMPENIVPYLTKRGVYAMAMGDDTMTVVNADAISASL